MATLSITLTITEPPNFLAQAAKAFSGVEWRICVPKTAYSYRQKYSSSLILKGGGKLHNSISQHSLDTSF